MYRNIRCAGGFSGVTICGQSFVHWPVDLQQARVHASVYLAQLQEHSEHCSHTDNLLGIGPPDSGGKLEIDNTPEILLESSNSQILKEAQIAQSVIAAALCTMNELSVKTLKYKETCSTTCIEEQRSL